jgi:hypothetical protein
VDGIDADAVDRGGSGARGRARHKAFDALEPAPNRRHRQGLAALTLFEQAQGQPQALNPQTDAAGRVTLPVRAPTP